MLEAKVTRKSVKRWPEKLNEVNREFIPLAGKIVLQAAKRFVPRDNSVLADSITLEEEKDRAIVGTNKGYAPHVEYGTRPHWIGGPVETNKGWRYIGQHPGTTAQPYMRPAIDKNRKSLRRLWESIYRRVYGR